MTDRITTLSVGTKGAEEWFRLFEQLSVLANRLGSSHHHVSISATAIDEIEVDDEPHENLHYDEFTIMKVRSAIIKALHDNLGDPPENLVDDLVGAMLNAGILFRERVKTDGMDRSRPPHS